MKGILALIPNRFRNVATLILGNGLSAIIPILISPLLTRIYSEEEFGILTLFLSVLIIVTSFSTGRYHMGILEAEEEEEAKDLAVISISVAFLISALLFFLILGVKSLNFQVRIIETLGSAANILPLGVFFTAVFQVTQSILNREQRYSKMANIKIVKSTSASILQLGFNFTRFKIMGLITGKVAGDMLSGVYGIYLVNKQKFFHGMRFSFSSLLETGTNYSKYLKSNTVHAVLTALASNVAPLVLSFLFTKEIVGYYGLSLRVCVIPVTLVSQAFFQVFSREIVLKFRDNEDSYGYLKKSVLQLVAIGVLPFSILFLFGPQLFSFVFGESWFLSGVYARLLIPYLFTSFVVSPLALVPVIKNYHNQALGLEFVGLIFKMISIIVGGYVFGPFYAVLFFSFSSTLMNLILFTWIIKLVRNR